MTLVCDPLDLQSVPLSAMIIWVLYQSVVFGLEWGGVTVVSSYPKPMFKRPAEIERTSCWSGL